MNLNSLPESFLILGIHLDMRLKLPVDLVGLVMVNRVMIGMAYSLILSEKYGRN